jgi:hypothetical protein
MAEGTTMRRSPAWRVSFGVLLVWAFAPAAAPAAEGFWVTLAAGIGGSATSTNDFWFDSPHGPPIAVTQVPTGGTAEAASGGGTVFFSSAGTPVLLNTSDGSAYVTNGAPDTARAASGKGAAPASAAPSAGGSVPSNSALLGLNLADPDATGVRALSATVTDPNGNPLGTGSVGVPDGGWWIVGLSPDAKTDPGPIEPPIPDPEPVPVPTPIPVPTPVPGPSSGPVATPEPTTLALLGIGGLTVGVWRKVKRRKMA